MIRARATARLVIAATLALAGCTATGSPGATAGAPAGSAGDGGSGSAGDPCPLLTQAEISMIVGQQVGSGSTDVDPNTCSWEYDLNGVPTIQVLLTIDAGSSFDDLCPPGPGSTTIGLSVVHLDGIGDGACFDTISGLPSGDNVTFQRGDTIITVAAATTNGTDAQLQLLDIALAKAALGHLGP